MYKSYLTQNDLVFLKQKKKKNKLQIRELTGYVKNNLKENDIMPRGKNPIDLRPEARVKSYE